MRVKVGDKIYDSLDIPIMLIFESDKALRNTVKLLGMMPPKEGIRKFAEYPDTMSVEEAKKFMELQKGE